MRLLFTLFFFITTVPWAFSQSSLNAAQSNFTKGEKYAKIKEGVEAIYQLNFTQSNKIIGQLEAELPQSPIPHLLKGLQTYWQSVPIYVYPDKLALFQGHMLNAVDKSEKILNKDPENTEALFLAMAAEGLLAETYADAGKSFKAVGAAKRSYSYIKKGFSRTDELKEFYLSTGLYNYYREYYPEAHPIYKPFMSFFMKGNKTLGIRQLEKAAREAALAHVLAKYYLCYIFMRYENIPAKALKHAGDLSRSYPRNLVFGAIYTETLMINKKYEQAIPQANRLLKTKNPYLSIYGQLFQGVIEEQHHANFENAKNNYLETIRLSQKHEMDRPQLESWANLGLGRIYLAQNNEKEARKYFKKAADMASARWTKDEARSYLKTSN